MTAMLPDNTMGHCDALDLTETSFRALVLNVLMSLDGLAGASSGSEEIVYTADPDKYQAPS